MISNIAKNSLYTKILIDFNCYVDTDVGLIRLIQKEYMDKSVFKESLASLGIKDIINLLYNRIDLNPLYQFANDNIPKSDLDEYYKQFLEKKKKEILSLSVSTELKSLVSLFINDGNINIDFLCKDEDEVNILKRENNLQKCNFVTLSDIKNNINNYYQFFFKYIIDLTEEFIYDYKTYYFSTCRLNFDKSGEDLLDIDIINKIIFHRSEIEIIDLYNKLLIDKES